MLDDLINVLTSQEDPAPEAKAPEAPDKEPDNVPKEEKDISDIYGQDFQEYCNSRRGR